MAAPDQASDEQGSDRNEAAHSGSLTTRITAARRWSADATEAAGEWTEHRRKHWAPLDLAITYYERDREALASVLGSAVALRMYLFFIPALAMVIGLAINVAVVGLAYHWQQVLVAVDVKNEAKNRARMIARQVICSTPRAAA